MKREFLVALNVRGYHQGYFLKQQFSLENIACRVTQNFTLSLKWRLHVFPKCYFISTMLDVFFFYLCSVHFEDSSIIAHQQMYQYYLLFKIGFNP
jgi:hypothetical protein